MTKAEVQRRLRDYILKDLIRNPSYPLADDEALIKGGLLDSLDMARLAVFVEAEFGVYLPDSDLTVQAMNTLEQMADQVLKRAAP
ncbi:MAG: acyl carrier protein [Anaerolineales bacterium]|jgi:acyl carrier protein